MAGKRSQERKKQRRKQRNKPAAKAAPKASASGYESDLDPIEAETPVEGGGGTMSSFRSGMRRAAGTSDGPKTGKDRLIDIALVALAGVAIFLVLKRFEII